MNDYEDSDEEEIFTCLNADTPVIDEFPDNLTSIFLIACSGLKKLPKFPENLRELTIKSCTGLVRLPNFPPYLKKLEIVNCHHLKYISELPSSLKELVVIRSEAKENFKIELPQGIEILYLFGPIVLENFPQSLRDISLDKNIWERYLNTLFSSALKHTSDCYETVNKLIDYILRRTSQKDFYIIDVWEIQKIKFSREQIFDILRPHLENCLVKRREGIKQIVGKEWLIPDVAGIVSQYSFKRSKKKKKSRGKRSK